MSAGINALNWTLQDYSIDHLIASGHFGIVYQATHLPTGRDVALKLIPLQGQDSDEKVAAERHGAVLQQRFGAAHRGLVPQVFEHQTIAPLLRDRDGARAGRQLTSLIADGPSVTPGGRDRARHRALPRKGASVRNRDRGTALRAHRARRPEAGSRAAARRRQHPRPRFRDRQGAGRAHARDHQQVGLGAVRLARAAAVGRPRQRARRLLVARRDAVRDARRLPAVPAGTSTTPACSTTRSGRQEAREPLPPHIDPVLVADRPQAAGAATRAAIPAGRRPLSATSKPSSTASRHRRVSNTRRRARRRFEFTPQDGCAVTPKPAGEGGTPRGAERADRAAAASTPGRACADVRVSARLPPGRRPPRVHHSGSAPRGFSSWPLSWRRRRPKASRSCARSGCACRFRPWTWPTCPVCGKRGTRSTRGHHSGSGRRVSRGALTTRLVQLADRAILEYQTDAPAVAQASGNRRSAALISPPRSRRPTRPSPASARTSADSCRGSPSAGRKRSGSFASPRASPHARQTHISDWRRSMPIPDSISTRKRLLRRSVPRRLADTRRAGVCASGPATCTCRSATAPVPRLESCRARSGSNS